MKTGKAIVFGVLLALTFIAFTGIASASTIYVHDYETIQSAVNIAYPGDTIIVRDGTYTENIKVDKRLTIRSENGPDSTIVLAEDPGDHVFEVTADYVKISGFMVEGAAWMAGIHLEADYCDISNNNCLNNSYGIYLGNSNNNSISNNNCSNNIAGIFLTRYAKNNSISNNNCSDNLDGISIWYSNNNSISDNNCSNNWAGLHFMDSNNNSISNNNCSNNKDKGILLENSNNNLIYLNSFINNTDNVDSSESTNTWNSPEKITYSYGRRTYKSHLGNYYDDYAGTDRNRDGIGDTPYQIDEDSDMYPLMKRWEDYHAPSERQSKIIYFILRWILED